MLEIELFQAPKKSDLRATAIVGDLGGTKARLALYGLLKKSTTPVILARANPLSSEVRSLPELLEDFYTTLKNNSLPYRRRNLVFAAAGIIENKGKKCRLTNSQLTVDLDELADSGTEAKLVNDFYAVAAAIPYIYLGDISQLSKGYKEKRNKKSLAIRPFNTGVAGPGTGLGVALLAYINGEHIPIPSEGGHTTFSPEDARQQAYYDYLRENVTQDRAPDIELVASGKGMVNIFRFLDKGELPNNRDYRRFTENVIRARANREWKRFAAKLDKLKDSEAGIELRKAYQGRFFHPVFDYMVEMFLEGLGQGIRHTANAFACYDGGVFIAGGNARRLTKEIKSSEHLRRSLRLAFPDSHREKIANMPIFLIEGDANKYAGTLGSAVTSFKDAGYI